MRIHVFASGKGGSTKTASAVNLAAALGELGHRVLVVDLDPQATASAYLGAEDEGRGLLDVFEEGAPLEPLVRDTSAGGVQVIPSSPILARAEALVSKPEAVAILRDALEDLQPLWDFVFLDTPPSNGFLFSSALVAADEVFLPVECSTTALGTVEEFGRKVKGLRALNRGLKVTGVLLGRVPPRTRLAESVLEFLRERFPRELFRTHVRETVRLRESWGHGESVLTYEPRGNAAADFRAVALEFLERRPKAKRAAG